MDIVSELSRIQKELHAPKSQYNSFGKYKYRNCEDILEALKGVMGESAVTVSDEIVLIGERYYVKATSSLRYKGEVISNIAYAREPENKKGMDEAQLTGATSSYARKYSLNGLFCIDDTKDADSQDNSARPVINDAAEFITRDQAKAINDAVNSNDGMDMDGLLKMISVSRLGEIPVNRFESILKVAKGDM